MTKKRSVINWGYLLALVIFAVMVSIFVYAQEAPDPYPIDIVTPTGPLQCIEVYPGYWDCI